ncbi:MAG TPA: S-layer homology domain-containing protein [Clostridiales bacterium]|nr:S-layer homology domain-containing protein [Clostridiales bacterium]
MTLGCVLLADNDPAPTGEQIKSAGNNIPGATVITWGQRILGDSETPVILNGAQDDTDYEFYAVCWKGDVFSEVRHLSVKTPAGSGSPGTPMLATPTGLQWDTTEGIKAKWNPVMNATSYDLTLWKEGNSTMLVQYNVSTGTELSLQSNIAGYTGNYYFTVQAKASDYTSSLKPASPIFSSVAATGKASAVAGYDSIHIDLSGTSRFSTNTAVVQNTSNWTLTPTGGTQTITSVTRYDDKYVRIVLSAPIQAGQTFTINAFTNVFAAGTVPFSPPLNVNITVPTPATGTAVATAGTKDIAVTLTSGTFGNSSVVQTKSFWTLGGASASGNPIASVAYVDSKHATVTLTNHIGASDIYTITAAQFVFINTGIAPFATPLLVTVEPGTITPQLDKATGLAWDTSSAGELKATWLAVLNANQYKVEYYKNGEKLGMTTHVNPPDTSTDDLKSNLLVYGAGSYTFTVQALGVYGGSYLDSEVSNPSAPYLHGLNSHTVTFHLNGGTRTGGGELIQTVPNGGAATAPVVTRSGCTFIGWDKDFTNVTQNLTVTANWSCNGGGNIPPNLNGTDHMKYVMGYSDGTVRPTAKITRAEVATMFYRLLTANRRDEIFTADNNFSDVSRSLWYNKAVSSMAAGGYILGYPNGSFGGNKAITRAEVVAIAVRFMAAQSGTVNFNDVPGNYWANEYIATAVAYGWIEGYPDGTFRPDQPITRAETMAIINRMLNRGVDADGLITGFKIWTDNPSEAWYYYDVIEATNDHEYTGARPNEKWISLSNDYEYDIAKYEHP